MRYTDYKNLMAEKSGLEELIKKLKSAPRNKLLTMFQDYYDGNQWDFSQLGHYQGDQGETRFSRSGKEMWPPLENKNIHKGFKKGELKTWNTIQAAVNIYAMYSRGDYNDDVQIKISNGDKQNKEKTAKLSALFTNLNEFVIDVVTDMSIQSVVVLCYTKLDQVEGDTQLKVFTKLSLSQQEDKDLAFIEMIDAREILPLYWKGMLRGVIRFYPVSRSAVKSEYNLEIEENEATYTEHWWVDDNGLVRVKKYVGVHEIKTSDVSGYEFIPYIIQANKKHNLHSFDLNNCEISDVANLIDIQDDYNAGLTDWGIINRKVAFPMLTMDKDFWKNADEMDMKKLQEYTQKLRTAPGDLITAPIQKLKGEGLPDSSVSFFEDTRSQINRQTGIPGSVYDSGSLANVSTDTIEHFMESLSKKVGEKREVVTNIIRKICNMHMLQLGIFDNEETIEVIYPDMFTIDKISKATMVREGKVAGILPSTYATSKYIELLGDTEKKNDILGEIQDEDTQLKLDTERAMATNKMRGRQSDILKQATEKANSLVDARNGTKPKKV